MAARRRGSQLVAPEWHSGLGRVTLRRGDGLARPRSTINTSSLVVFGGYVRRMVILCSTSVRYFRSIPAPINRFISACTFHLLKPARMHTFLSVSINTELFNSRYFTEALPYDQKPNIYGTFTVTRVIRNNSAPFSLSIRRRGNTEIEGLSPSRSCVTFFGIPGLGFTVSRHHHQLDFIIIIIIIIIDHGQ